MPLALRERKNKLYPEAAFVPCHTYIRRPAWWLRFLASRRNPGYFPGFVLGVVLGLVFGAVSAGVAQPVAWYFAVAWAGAFLVLEATALLGMWRRR